MTNEHLLRSGKERADGVSSVGSALRGVPVVGNRRLPAFAQERHRGRSLQFEGEGIKR